MYNCFSYISTIVEIKYLFWLYDEKNKTKNLDYVVQCEDPAMQKTKSLPLINQLISI